MALSRVCDGMPPTSSAFLWPYGDSSPRDSWAKKGESGGGGGTVWDTSKGLDDDTIYAR